MNRANDPKVKEGEIPAELESQFILRLPPEPAKVLRELIQSGANNLKDRLSIRIENDMRTGEVRLDHMLLHAKVVDFPTIIESLKTIDNKSFYKTADICQMLVCKEDDDQTTTTDEEMPSKAKKKDPNRVDKKYLHPHGLTPPMKNVRKKRFRKTLKKKYVEAPEIEKEVKRLLRVDNEAVNVKWEVINEDEDKGKINVKEEQMGENHAPSKPIKAETSIETTTQQSVDVDFERGKIVGARLAGASVTETSALCNVSRGTVSTVMTAYIKHGKTSSAKGDSGRKSKLTDRDRQLLQRIMAKRRNTTTAKITAELNVHITKPVSTKTVRRELQKLFMHAEHDIFGSAVSDSEEETNINIMEMEDTSRLSGDDSRLSDTVSLGVNQPQDQPDRQQQQQLVTQFSKDMFRNSMNMKDEPSNFEFEDMEMKQENYEFKSESQYDDNDTMSKESIKERMDTLSKELADLKMRRQQQEMEINNIENMALRQRLQDIIDNLLTEQLEKEHEYEELRRMLQ